MTRLFDNVFLSAFSAPVSAGLRWPAMEFTMTVACNRKVAF